MNLGFSLVLGYYYSSKVATRREIVKIYNDDGSFLNLSGQGTLMFDRSYTSQTAPQMFETLELLNNALIVVKVAYIMNH